MKVGGGMKFSDGEVVLYKPDFIKVNICGEPYKAKQSDGKIVEFVLLDRGYGTIQPHVIESIRKLTKKDEEIFRYIEKKESE